MEVTCTTSSVGRPTENVGPTTDLLSDSEDVDYAAEKDCSEALPLLAYTQDVYCPSDDKTAGLHKSPEINSSYSVVRPRRYAQSKISNAQICLSPIPNKLIRTKHKNERTPNTLLRMMERHRQNERVRHHTLNKSMVEVCSKVPGNGNFLKETKVVMMQRIIAYICYLENTLHNVCDNLGMKISQLRLPTNLLTDQWQQDKYKVKVSTVNTFNPSKMRIRDVKEPCVRPYKPRTKILKRLEPVYKRHLKVSSPTIDSTTDSAVVSEASALETKSDLSKNEEEEPQTRKADFHIIGRPYGDDMDAFIDHNACSVPAALEDTPSYFTDDFLPTSTTLDNFPDAFDLMSSPLGARSKYVLLSPKLKAIESCTDFGIRSDIQCEYINVHEMRTISPECVLPTTPSPQVHSALNDSYGFKNLPVSIRPSVQYGSDILRTPDKSTLKLKNKRKQYTPHRSPFHNLTNFSQVESLDSSDEDEPLPQLFQTYQNHQSRSTGSRRSKIDEDFVSYVPYIWKFHNTAITRRQKAEAAKLKVQDLPCNEECQLDRKCDEHLSSRPAKIDHRKTTWMNGFMMFSRLNRRKFIEANPGVHTSHISKMMGHAWRHMTAQEQLPYKEKAKEYARCIPHEDGKVEFSTKEEVGISAVPLVSSSGLSASLDNSNGDSVDAALHQHMVPFNIQ